VVYYVLSRGGQYANSNGRVMTTARGGVSFTVKKYVRKSQKPLDKYIPLWYNKTIPKERERY
jgi:hypothetical protein